MSGYSPGAVVVPGLGGLSARDLPQVPPELLLLCPAPPAPGSLLWRLLSAPHICVCWQCPVLEPGFRCPCCPRARAHPRPWLCPGVGSRSLGMELLVESRACGSLGQCWHPPAAVRDPRSHGWPFGVSRAVSLYPPSSNTSGKPQLGLPAPSTPLARGIHPPLPRQVARWGWHRGTAAVLWGSRGGTPAPLPSVGRCWGCGSARGKVSPRGFARRVPRVQDTSPGDGEHTRLLVTTLQGFRGPGKAPGWGSAPVLACSTSSMAWHMLCCKWALCTCLGCCSLKSIAMATAPSHAVHSCCRRDKEHILKQHILNVDVLKCNF